MWLSGSPHNQEERLIATKKSTGHTGIDLAPHIGMVTVDSQFILWGSAYVLLKWTFGVWAFRRVKAYAASART